MHTACVSIGDIVTIVNMSRTVTHVGAVIQVHADHLYIDIPTLGNVLVDGKQWDIVSIRRQDV
jgi:hypothetical protein